MASDLGIPPDRDGVSPLYQNGDDTLGEVLEALSEGLALFDDHGRLIRSNAGFKALNPHVADLISPGLAWDVLLREWTIRGTFSAAIRQRLEWMEMGLAGDEGNTGPLEVEAQSGKHFEISLRPTRQGGFVVSQVDITQRRDYEESEREADLLLRMVLEACPANVVMSRVGDGQIIYRSPAATELLGMIRNLHEFFARRDERGDFITALLPSGRVDDLPITGIRADGQQFPCLISARLIDYRGEEVMVSSAVDISKEVAMRKTLAVQREQIFQAEKMSALGELLAGVAHELNNPLSVVVGHALMMREETTDAETLRRIEKISEAAERCARIVKSFLAMARQQPARLAPVDIAEIFETAVDALLQSQSGLKCDVSLDFPLGLPPVQADQHQLMQVAINLVTNADQAIRESRVGNIVRITGRHDTAADMVEIRVADNGPGVAPEIRGRIFDPLFTTKEAGQGTGIGLAYCQRAITSHSGRIWLEDGAGGATFVIRLPISHGSELPASEENAVGTEDYSGRVLVVDDEPEVAELIREILTKDGFTVDSAESAEAALAIARGHSYAAILTDLNMPGMGGRGFFETIRRDLPALAARIAFVTGDIMSPQARTFLDSAGRPCLEKPIAPQELRVLVRRMIETS